MDVSQIILSIFLLMLGGVSGWIVTRITKHADAMGKIERDLAVALNDIAHLKEKANTHTAHIDALFEMKTIMAQMQAQVAALSDVMPQVMQVMQQMAALLVKKAA